MIPHFSYSFNSLFAASSSAAAMPPASDSFSSTAPASPIPAKNPKSRLEIIPKDLFNIVMEFVVGGPLFKKCGFEGEQADKEIKSFYSSLVSCPLYDHKVFDMVLLKQQRSLDLPFLELSIYDCIRDTELMKRLAYRNLKLGKAIITTAYPLRSRFDINPLNADNTVLISKRGSDGHRDNHRVKVSLGLIRDYDKFEVNSSLLPIYFVATDRGLLVYDPNNQDQPLETPLYGIDIKLKKIQWNTRNASLEGLCDDGSWVSIEFNFNRIIMGLLKLRRNTMFTFLADRY